MIELMRSASRIAAIVLVASTGACTSDDGGQTSGQHGSGGSSNTGGSAGTGGGAQGGDQTDSGGSSNPNTGGMSGAGSGGIAGAGSGGMPIASGGAGGAVASGGASGSDGGPTGNSGILIDPPPELIWSRESSIYPYFGIWGNGANDIYAVGDLGKIAHSVGNGVWEPQTSNTQAKLTGVWASGPNDIYVSALANVILHSTGDGMWELQGAPSGYTFRSVWGTGPNDIYAGGSGIMHTTGDGIWTAFGNVTSRALWGSSSTDIYSASGGTDMNHSTGNGVWASQSTAGPNLYDVWGTGPNDVYAVANAAIFHSTGDRIWTEQSTPPIPEPESRECVFALNEHAIYVGTFDGRLLRSGGDGRWVVQDLLVDMNADITAIWGTSVYDLYLATDAGIYHGAAP